MLLWAWLLRHHLCHISACEGQSPCCHVALEWLPISFLYRVVLRSLSLDTFASGASSWTHWGLCHRDRSLRLASTMLTLALHFAFYICFNLNEALCWKIDRHSNEEWVITVLCIQKEMSVLQLNLHCFLYLSARWILNFFKILLLIKAAFQYPFFLKIHRHFPFPSLLFISKKPHHFKSICAEFLFCFPRKSEKM